MREAAEKELVRQLVEMGHHFGKCGTCGDSFSAEYPIVGDGCPTTGCDDVLIDDRDGAARAYTAVIQHAEEAYP